MSWIQMHYKGIVIAAYIAGAVLTLAVKLARCIRYEKSQGVPARKAIYDWFLEPSMENSVSWVTTWGLVWCIGAAYVNEWTSIIFPEYAEHVPIRIPLAFFLGSLAEWLGPTIVKAVSDAAIAVVEAVRDKIKGMVAGSGSGSPGGGG